MNRASGRPSVVGIGGLTQLYTRILLPKPGEDWANSVDRMRLYVTMPRAAPS
ncbi:MAG: hypothetical protein WAV26_06840 [Candidatus Deferrimicrobium sp.]